MTKEQKVTVKEIVAKLLGCTTEDLERRRPSEKSLKVWGNSVAKLAGAVG